MVISHLFSEDSILLFVIKVFQLKIVTFITNSNYEARPLVAT